MLVSCIRSIVRAIIRPVIGGGDAGPRPDMVEWRDGDGNVILDAEIKPIFS